ncbi:hypothetical protein K440DRAFT_638810 [Wilcoxina mikolae CBS 423.85]|nr:hypothetical protein K440DRAFT_638810 [Wilcoxina mikolae CBS 423.85]
MAEATWTICQYCDQSVPPMRRVAHMVLEHQVMLCEKREHRRPDTVNKYGHSRIVRETNIGNYVLACGCLKHEPDGVLLVIGGTDGGMRLILSSGGSTSGEKQDTGS